MDCTGLALARPTLVHKPTCVPRSGHGSSLDLCASLGQAPLHLDGGTVVRAGRSVVPSRALSHLAPSHALPAVLGTPPADHMSALTWSAAGARSRAGTLGSFPAKASCRIHRRSISADANGLVHSDLRSSLDAAKIEEKLLARSNPSHAEQTNHAPLSSPGSIASNREQAGQNGSWPCTSPLLNRSNNCARVFTQTRRWPASRATRANVDNRGRLGCVRQMPCRVLKAKLSAPQRTPSGRSAVRQTL